jgi:hypothetical protein
MKRFVPLLLVVAAPAVAAPADLPAASPLKGSWAVDIARLPIPPEARPKSVTITFADAGAGKWSMAVEIVNNGGGAPIHMASTWAPDGTPVSGLVGPEADTIAVKMPTPGVMVAGLSKGSVPVSTRVYAVAPDGQSMVETASYFTADGKPLLRTNYFTRIK